MLSCLQSLAREKKHLEKENKKLKQTAIAVQIDDLVNSAVSLGELRLVVKRL